MDMEHRFNIRLWPLAALYLASVFVVPFPSTIAAQHHRVARTPWIKQGHSVFNLPVMPDGLRAQPKGNVQAVDLSDKKPDQLTLFIPADDNTGVAAFWSGTDFMIVGDRPRLGWGSLPVEGSIYGNQDVISLNKATILRISFPQQIPLHLEKVAGGWRLSPFSPKTSPCWPVQPQKEGDALLFPFSYAGHIVTLWNPTTGSRVYVATVRAPQCVLRPQRNMGYSIAPAMLGSFVEDYDNRIIERSSSLGPLLQMVSIQDVFKREDKAQDTQPLLSGARDASAFFVQKWHKDEAFLHRMRDKNHETVQKIVKRGPRHRRVKVTEKISHPLPPSLIVDVAQSALWAGHPQRTWDILHAYPLQGDVADLLLRRRALLLAYCGILTGRPEEAVMLKDPLLALEPSMAVWHGYYLMHMGYDSRLSSALLTNSFPTFLDFPSPLQRIMLPSIAFYLAQYGDPSIRNELLELLPPTPDYDFTRAILYIGRGEKDKSFDILKKMAASPNSFRTVLARSLLSYLFMKDGLIDAKSAADEESKLLSGDMGSNRRTDFDSEDFLEVAALIKGYAIQAMLRSHEDCRAVVLLQNQQPTLFLPEDQLDQLWRALLKQLIFTPFDRRGTSVLGAGTCVATLDQRHTLLAQNMPHLEDAPQNAKLLEGYAHFLLRAHQPSQAIPVLLKLEFLTQDPYSREEILEKLVSAALQTNALQTASLAIQRAHIPELPEDSAYQLKYDEAALEVEKGDDEGALLLLGDDQSNDGLRMKGRIYEDTGQWRKAIDTLYYLARRSMGPATSYMEPDQHELVHRIISDVTHLQDYQPPADLLRWNQLPVRGQ